MASKKKKANAQTLQWNNKPCQDYTKRDAETNTMAARGHKTCTKKQTNPEQGIFQTGSQTKHEICQEIFTIIFSLFIFSYKMLKS